MATVENAAEPNAVVDKHLGKRKPGYFEAVTISADFDVPVGVSQIWCNTAGNLICVDKDGNQATFIVTASSLAPVVPTTIKGTSTATDLILIW